MYKRKTISAKERDVAKSVTGFRLSDQELEMIDAVAKHYKLDNRTEAIQWLVRREYFSLELLTRRIADLENELAILRGSGAD